MNYLPIPINYTRNSGIIKVLIKPFQNPTAWGIYDGSIGAIRECCPCFGIPFGGKRVPCHGWPPAGQPVIVQDKYYRGYFLFTERVIYLSL